MLLDRHWEIRPAFDSSIVGDDHYFTVANAPDAGDDSRAGSFVIIEVSGSEGRELKERRTGVQQAVDPFSDEELALLLLSLTIFLTTPFTNARQTFFEFVRESFVMFGVLFEFRRSEEHTSELHSPFNLVCRFLLGKKKMKVS